MKINTLLLIFLVAIGAVFAYLNYMRFVKRSETENFQMPDSQTDSAGIEEFVNRVRALSEETAAIDISGCDPKPKFSKISGEKFTLQNKDAIVHTIIFNEGQFNVPAKNSIEISSAIFKSGVYGFGCDDAAGSNTAVGFIDLSK